MARIIHTEHGKFILSDPGKGKLRNERDILDLMGLFGEAGEYLLLIAEGALYKDFFDLSTGLAGEICHKLSTYRVKTAIVADIETVPSQPFREWAGECNRGGEIRFCADMDEAERWLLDLER